MVGEFDIWIWYILEYRKYLCTNYKYGLPCGSNGKESACNEEVKWREVAQSCPTLCDPMDCSLLGFSIHGIFQARILEWVAISFSMKEWRRSLQWRRLGFNSWVRKFPWRKVWQHNLIFLPGKSHGQKSLAGYIGPWQVREVVPKHPFNLVDGNSLHYSSAILHFIDIDW